MMPAVYRCENAVLPKEDPRAFLFTEKRTVPPTFKEAIQVVAQDRFQLCRLDWVQGSLLREDLYLRRLCVGSLILFPCQRRRLDADFQEQAANGYPLAAFLRLSTEEQGLRGWQAYPGLSLMVEIEHKGQTDPIEVVLLWRGWKLPPTQEDIQRAQEWENILKGNS